MNAPELDINEVTNMYRILGITLSASREEVRKARNKLVVQFHPDKHVVNWQADSTKLEIHIHLIQTAYEFIMQNYENIQSCLSYLPNETLTSRLPIKARSHWVYVQVASKDKDV